MKLFLDDVREPKDCFGYMFARIGRLQEIYLEEWVVVRNYEKFVFGKLGLKTFTISAKVFSWVLVNASSPTSSDAAK